MTLQAERALQEEILWRLRAYPVLPIVTPNGLHIEAASREERSARNQIIGRMKAQGMLVAGAADLVLLWRGGGGLVELKRPAGANLLKSWRAGEPSPDQQEFAERCRRIGIRHAYCRSWDQFREQLGQWGAL